MIEPDAGSVEYDRDAAVVSIAISLKRIADMMEEMRDPPVMKEAQPSEPQICPGCGQSIDEPSNALKCNRYQMHVPF